MMTVRWLTLALGAGGAWLGVAGCSTTTTLVPQPRPKEIAVPDYAYLPHPRGYTTGDVQLLFTEKSAPSREALAKCQDDFRALYKKVDSIEERARGVRELVSRDPAAYHWCFYSQILDLADGLGKDDFVDEKQKRIMTTYEYLVPVARAFMQEFQDSRYVRWAIKDYRRLADLYFYRKVELSPEMSGELVDVAVPVDLKPAQTYEDVSKASVIDKYKIADSLANVKPKEQEEAVPPPAPQSEVAAKPEPKKEEAPDPEAVETLEFAEQLARQRKETQANRAPAQAPDQLPAPAPSQASSSAQPEATSRFPAVDPSERK